MPRNKPKKPLIEAPPEPESSDSDPSQPVSKSKPNFIPKPTVAALPAQLIKPKRVRKEKHALVGPEGSSKKLFERVFSEDDEIVILKGLVEFKGKNDDEFCDFLKDLLHVEVNKAQFFDKIRRLKKKFYVNKRKKRKIINEHDKIVFELSKQVWNHVDDDNGNVGLKSGSKGLRGNSDDGGGGDDNDNVGLKSGSKGLRGDVDNNGVFVKDKEVGNEGLKEGIRGEAFRRMGARKRDEIREMWRKVEIAQLKVDLMRCEARVEEKKRVMEALGLGKY